MPEHTGLEATFQRFSETKRRPTGLLQHSPAKSKAHGKHEQTMLVRMETTRYFILSPCMVSTSALMHVLLAVLESGNASVERMLMTKAEARLRSRLCTCVHGNFSGSESIRIRMDVQMKGNSALLFGSGKHCSWYQWCCRQSLPR